MPPDLPNEKELILKKRARRRLVGAIALVLLMVIILPRILQDRATSAPQEAIKITMPGETSNQQVEILSTSIVPVEPQVDSPVTDEAIKTENPIALEAASEAKTENKNSVVKVEKKAEIKTTETELPQKNGGSYTIQVGVYSDIANVKNLQTKLKQAGLTSRIEKITTPKGEKIRLKTGNFSSRQGAADALIKLQEAGLPGMVISNE